MDAQDRADYAERLLAGPKGPRKGPPHERHEPGRGPDHDPGRGSRVRGEVVGPVPGPGLRPPGLRPPGRRRSRGCGRCPWPRRARNRRA
jgi:hypothetical protein